ncbi:hypothetical protein GDO81_027951 [Engystomops pustulosus]|uniref:Uncharacterized protein n=1 Tax=Engystomops pustulosus TaxID=76066 RepID=A0AAV6Z7L6_ENGPU|nr:hypothetical protein GDO81_027951 [Engystomops pustulosus]
MYYLHSQNYQFVLFCLLGSLWWEQHLQLRLIHQDLYSFLFLKVHYLEHFQIHLDLYQLQELYLKQCPPTHHWSGVFLHLLRRRVGSEGLHFPHSLL